MKIIKRTKITVIRTESIFLKNQGDENSVNYSPIQITSLTENYKQDSVLEIEAVESTEKESYTQGELK